MVSVDWEGTRQSTMAFQWGDLHQYEGGAVPEGLPSGDTNGGYSPASSIFGWSWLGEWAATPNAPAEVQAWLQGWVEQFNAAAEGELAGAIGWETQVVIQNFLSDLATQDWWQEKSAAWQEINQIRYGTDVPRSEYDRLVQSTRDYVEQVARALGFVDQYGGLTFDINGEEITALIEGQDGLLYNAFTVDAGGNLSQSENLADTLIEEYFLVGRDFETAEGVPEVGPGELRGIYDWIQGLAASNYISLDDEEGWDMVYGIKREELTYSGAWNIIANQIGDTYDFLDGSNILNRINQFYTGDDGLGGSGGSSLKNHLKPVRQTIAETWGLGENEVRLNDIFGRHLEDLTIDDDGSERFMNSREARRWARQQPQFLQTEEYGTGMQGMVSAMLNLFGAR